MNRDRAAQKSVTGGSAGIDIFDGPGDDQSQAEGFSPEAGSPGGPRTGGQHRLPSDARRGRQRPIRATLTVLLVIPLVSLIALWAYAASSTVGGALAKRNSDTVNKDIGAPTQALLLDLNQERAESFAAQSAQVMVSLLPRATPRADLARAQATASELRAGLAAQRKQTDAALAAFRAGAGKASGAEPAVARSAVSAFLAKTGELRGIRAGVDAGTLAPLPAFQAYNDVIGASFPFSLGALANPDASIPFYQQSQGVGDEAEAFEFVGREAALMGGALISGGRMSAAEHQLFLQAVDYQRFLEQIGHTPVYWQQSADPYLAVFASPAYQQFKAMEDKIVATPPLAKLPVGAQDWQSGLQALMGPYLQAETAARLAVTRGDTHAGNVTLLRLFLVGGAGLLAVIVSALLLLGFGGRIARELISLRSAARELAEERLPSLVSRLGDGEDVDVDTEAPPLALRTRTREVTETADAFSAVRHTAVEAAVGQAQLRKGVSSVFRSLSRRNQSLLQRQLKMLEEMEHGTQDPEALAQLFRLDHLTTRMRRQAEGLIILSGAAPGRGWRRPVPLVEVLRGAIGEIEDYVRVDMVTESRDFMPGAAVADVTHLLAELIENATLYSPPNTRVQVRASRVARGYVVEIEDRGLGISGDLLTVLNERLARPPEFDLANSDQLGLFVVSRLAARHGIKVALRASAYGGTAAIVLMPHQLVVSEDDTPAAALSKGAVSNGAVSAAVAGAGPVAVAGAAAGRVGAGVAGLGAGPGAFPGDLPRRLRQASLAPELRDAPGAQARTGGEERSAEQARSLISSIQQGWRTGRTAAGESEAGRGDGFGENPRSDEGEIQR
ncbi:MAG TPA: nitrate- and nitrite sensing domain-containing protein [Streptosporangiaceae bacterium]